MQPESDLLAVGRDGVQLERRDDDNGVVAGGGEVQMHARAHHFGHVHARGDTAGLCEHDVLRADAERHGAGRNAVAEERGLLVLGELHLLAADLDGVLVAVALELGVEEVHLRRADEPGDEEVGGLIEHFLRRADLLNEAVAHDDDAVAKRHGLGLVVGDVDERGIDLVAQLDDLGAHLVAEFGVEVGERLVHEEHLGAAHDGAADGDALALAAGERLRLAVEQGGDIEDLRGLADLLVDLGLRELLELERERHVLVNGHVGVKSIVLEYHGDVAVLGRHVVHALAVDEKIARGDLLQTGDHAQRCGFAAAGRTDEHDKFPVGDIQRELLHCNDALFGDLQVVLLLGGLALFLFRAALIGIDLLDVYQTNFCHVYRS